MKFEKKHILFLIGAVLVVAGLAALPLALKDYGDGLLLGLFSYITLASAWALFSGPTKYISLATVAFYGTGAYTVAVLNETLPFAVVLVVALLIGLVISLLVGLATLRLAGVYFVIFSFGLAEMVRQLITWFETRVTGTLGRYVFVDLTTTHLYWMLLGLACLTLFIRWWIGESRLGLAIHAIGDDETVARHAGVNVTLVKLALFAISAAIITLVGAIQSPRYVYIEPSIVFSPTVSFLTLIMALLGGATRTWGPVFGAVPLFFLFEWLSTNLPDHFSIVLGLIFVGIVFIVPNGVLALIEGLFTRKRRGTRT
ncbi:branched-chain amino acid ABC transporter permease [uncultured Maritimibacter sp.]|jgi:branched-chain amino acid transport system permease protein|uniref:branched-chain amino acid ABC transporter permease n=1 Tax=uncultured Maritimibacter sp. TaxID=991866 RepID=UPI000B2FBEE4|nr:branched-chain amino acid ABC transporter permease [uncultured Maritimibacter sp.]